MTKKAYISKVGDQVLLDGQGTKRFLVTMVLEANKTVVLQEPPENPNML
jgi:hypothetical protein